jgi:hypothetical protein
MKVLMRKRQIKTKLATAIVAAIAATPTVALSLLLL